MPLGKFVKLIISSRLCAAAVEQCQDSLFPQMACDCLAYSRIESWRRSQPSAVSPVGCPGRPEVANMFVRLMFDDVDVCISKCTQNDTMPEKVPRDAAL